MTWTVSDRPNILGHRENLCWYCTKSVARCSWSRNNVPIEGWDAEPDTIRAMRNSGCIESYKIYDCPFFEREPKTKDSPKSFADIIREMNEDELSKFVCETVLEKNCEKCKWSEGCDEKRNGILKWLILEKTGGKKNEKILFP